MLKVIEPTVRDFLTGRIWLRKHTPFSRELINLHIASGDIEITEGVISTKRFAHQTTHICNRCENDEQDRFFTYNCAKCQGACTYCRHCLKMGRVSSCTELITWIGEPQTYPTSHRFAWAGSLTPSQQQASDELSDSTTKQIPHLIHAVCGSGKTEILFEPIYKLLLAGKRVCITAPRVDVILELEPRFRAAFPRTAIQALYGGAESTTESAQLILATTHQLYRFKNAFDAIFIDEADAFPYTAEKTLQRAVRKAIKSNSPIHFVTATPSDKLLADVKKNGRISSITRRYHGHPLPSPRYDSLWNYTKQIEKGKLPQKLLQWTQTRLANNEPFLLFFPTIELMGKAELLFQSLDPLIVAVHASHPKRKERVQQLRDKTVPGLLTTTILERGITIPNVQVAVVGSEQAIFTKGALIQIGGRVGRAAQFPTGHFVLFHHGITYAMDGARSEILRLNKGEVHK